METEKRKLTDDQLRLVQGVAGILSAAALMASIALSQELSNTSSLLGYLFVAVFLLITIGRRWVENKYRIRLNFFNLVLIDGILGGILVYAVIMLYFAKEPVQISEIVKILIIIGLCILIIVPGIALPLRKYLKRKEKGEVPPIRIPEKTEEEKEKESKMLQNNGRSSISQQIAEMTKELEEKDKQEK